MRRPRTFIGPQGMAGMVGLWGASSLVESVQYGTITVGTSTTGAITSVDVSRSVVLILGISTSYSSPINQESAVRVALTNATTVTATRYDNSGTCIVSYVVMQFAPGVVKSIQQGTIVVSTTSNTGAVTEVNVAKSVLIFAGHETNTYLADSDGYGRVTLTNGTTITATRGSASAGTVTAAYQLLEMF